MENVGGQNVIAAGLMRRHNCTIIVDRFITRVARRILLYRIANAHASCPRRYVRKVRNDNYTKGLIVREGEREDEPRARFAAAECVTCNCARALPVGEAISLENKVRFV